MGALDGRIAVVTGASRGAGKAIALELGAAGATVYATGRSTRAAGTTGDVPGTIEETAEAVTAAGGKGVAVRVDHTVDAEVDALFDRVQAEQGRLDVLVNNAWGGYEHQHDLQAFVKPFWEQPRGRWEAMFVAGVRTHFIASARAAPLMIPGKRGLIASTLAWAFGRYLMNLYYDVAKASIARMCLGMAEELRPFGVAAVAVAPGFMRTERVQAYHAGEDFDWSVTESPRYLGRAIAALAADAEVLRYSGQVLTAGELARSYGFTDVDGRQPPPFRMPEP